MIKRQKTQNNAGFTLMEIVVAIVVMGFIGYFISGFINNQTKLMQFVKERQDIDKQTLKAQDRLMQEIKMLDSLLVADETELSFLGQDGLQIDYTLSSSGIDRVEDGAVERTLIPSIDLGNSYFKYYDAGGNELTNVALNAADRELVHLVEVTVTVVSGSQSNTSRRRLLIENRRW